jgi:TM2 domain-containing membrane protein YozV
LADTASSEKPPAAPPPFQTASAEPLPTPHQVMAMALAWLVPGLGHVYLKRAVRGVIFFALVMIALGVGISLQGNLYQPIRLQWLTYLATFGQACSGIPYFVLRYGFHYQGQQEAAGYEYGTAFLLTAGLMNLLLVLDARDIASGQKE